MTIEASANEHTEGGTFKTTWAGLGQADPNGNWVKGPGQADRSIHVFGDFDGATLILWGTHETIVIEANKARVHDAFGDLIAVMGNNGFVALAENPYWFKPEVLNPGASTNLTVIANGRSTKI